MESVIVAGTISVKVCETALPKAKETEDVIALPDTVRRMAGHYRILLEGIGANADARISEFPLLTLQEREQLLFEWNNTRRDYPTNVFLHRFFEKQVEGSPDSVAVQFEGQNLTYRQLNGRANQLAHYLQKLGIGPDRIVGILAERSPEMLTGILAILKAGGAYLPLEPTYPRERLAFILEDANPAASISGGPFLEVVRQELILRLCVRRMYDWLTPGC